MRKSEWSDEQVEELLSQLPRIKDDRNSSEIYQLIAIKLNKRKQRMWIMPSVATAAAVLLVFILSPNLFNWHGFEEKSSEHADKSSAPEVAMEKRSIIESEDQNPALNESEVPSQDNGENSKMSLTSIEMNDQSTAVYEEDLSDKEVLTYAIPDKYAQHIIPVSILVPIDHQKSKFEMFKENMAYLTEEEWGLSDYFPLNADLIFDEDNRVLTVDVPADHSYSLSTNSEWLLNQVLSNTMSTLDIQKINFTTEGNPGIMLSHQGLINQLNIDKKIGQNAYYFYYPSNIQTKPFIVPFVINKKQATINDAFTAMRKNNGDLIASIPENLQFHTEEDPNENKLVVRIEESSLLNNDDDTLHTIEAILLTAKEFNYNVVKIENANIDQIGRFDLNQEIKVPVAPNKRIILNE